MNEAQDKRRQVERLQARFKATGIVNPAEQVWKPTPTAGDHARALGADILREREAEAAQADKAAREFWNS